MEVVEHVHMGQIEANIPYFKCHVNILTETARSNIDQNPIKFFIKKTAVVKHKNNTTVIESQTTQSHFVPFYTVFLCSVRFFDVECQMCL